MHTITEVLIEKNLQWNIKCGGRNSSLFLSDNFLPKPIPEKAQPEMCFWYDITNLNAFFSDCAPYLFRTSNVYQKSKIKLSTDSPILSLLDIMVHYATLSADDAQSVKNFINGIRELRSCFCHNKPEISLKRKTIERGLGYNNQCWTVFPHLGRNTDLFNYEQACADIAKRTNVIITIIDSMIDAICQRDSDDAILEWSRSITAWYFGSEDIVNRCLASYYRSHFQKVAMGEQLSQWRKILSLESIENAQENATEFLKESFEEMTEIVFNFHMVAAPECVLPLFFDKIL